MNVADKHNHRIQVFTGEGKFLRMFGRCGRGSGELGRPMGVAIDARDMVYVSEWVVIVSLCSPQRVSLCIDK